jgi:hypothetical protein
MEEPQEYHTYSGVKLLRKFKRKFYLNLKNPIVMLQLFTRLFKNLFA